MFGLFVGSLLFGAAACVCAILAITTGAIGIVAGFAAGLGMKGVI